MAFGSVSAERAAIEMTYEDTADVMRMVPVPDEDGITQYQPMVVHQGVICGLSYQGGDRSGQTKAQNDIDWDAVIFFRPEDTVESGNNITLKRFGRDKPVSAHLIEFSVVGRPAVYATHQEVRVREETIL